MESHLVKRLKTQRKKPKETEQISTDLQVDHLNIWVDNPTLTKNKLLEIGFTTLPDSVSAVHHGQGTAGRYFYFLNGYLELIFVNNQAELKENNKTNTDLDFTLRSAHEQNGASPISIAFKVKDYAIEKIPFKTVKYHQDWMDEDFSIYAAKNSKNNLKEPSIFVVYPEIQADTFNTLDDLKNIPEEYAMYREFFKHPNGAKKLTKILITSTTDDLETGTMKSSNEIPNLEIKKGSEHLLELFFDYQIQGKSFDLRPELPLVVYL